MIKLGGEIVRKKLEYYFKCNKSTKKVTIHIQKKKWQDRYKKRQYITMTGSDRYPLDQLNIKDIENTLSAFGKILVATDDETEKASTSQEKRM